MRTRNNDGAELLIRVRTDSASAQKDLKEFFAVARNENQKEVASRSLTARQIIRLNEEKQKSAARVAEAEAKAARQIQKSLVDTERARTEAVRRQILLDREAERSAARRAKAEAPRPNAFMQGVLSSRFALPGTNGNVMPLVGQTLKGGALSLAGFAAIGGLSELASAGADAVRIGAQLEKTLNVLQAQSDATDGEMRKVAETARLLGADITIPKANANDAAVAMLELSKAGLSVRQSMDAARGTLLLAAAAEVDAGSAAKMTANLLNAFSLEGDKATVVADLLAAASVSAQGEITDMGDAMKQSAAVFASAQSPVVGAEQAMRDLTTATAQMAKAGISGSDAGTSIKTAVLALSAPTKEAKKVMEALGISIYDTNGQMRPFREIIDQVSRGVEGLTQEERDWALKTIFGTDAIRAANIVLAKGTKEFDSMAASVNKAGQAAKLGEAQTKGYAGAVESFNNAMEDAKERAIAPFLGGLAEIVRLGADVVGALRDINQAGADLSGSPWWGTLAQNIKDLREYLQLSGRVARTNASLPGKAATALNDASLFRSTNVTATPDVIVAAARYGINVNASMSGAQLKAALDQAAGKADAETARLQSEMRRQDRVENAERNDDAETRRRMGATTRQAGGRWDAKGKWIPNGPPAGGKSTGDKRSGLRGLMNDGSAARKKQAAQDKAQREAEAKARAARMDKLQSALRAEGEKLAGMQFVFGETMGVMGTATDDEQILGLAVALRAQADAIEKQQRVVAQAAKNVAIAGSPDNTRAAGAEFRGALGTSRRDRQSSENRIEDAIADARKRQKDAKEKQAETAEKQAEADRKRYDESVKSYAAFLEAEEAEIQRRLGQASNLQDAQKLIQQLGDNRLRTAGITMQSGIVESMRSGDWLGLQTALLTFATAANTLVQQQTEMLDAAGGTFAVDATQFPTYSPEEAGTSPGRRLGRNIEDAAQSSFTGLLSGGDGRGFLRELFSSARNEVANSVVSEIAKNVNVKDMKELFGDFGKVLKDNIKGLDLSAKGLITAAVMINGALSILGANGGKKQKQSIFGALAGLAIGSFIPGGNLVTDALFGAGIGGFFAEGGEPPVGRMSWVHANELWIPKEPGNILNSKQVAALERSVGGFGGRGGTVIYIDTVNDRGDVDYLVQQQDYQRERAAGFPGG